MNKLALRGGDPVVPKSLHPRWPEVLKSDEEAVLNALRAEDYTPLTRNGAVETLEQRWADRVGVGYCVGVSNGTTALSLALVAAGVRPGDHVIVPALTFIAPALAVVHIGAIPIFADVNPISFNIDPADIRHRITEKTTAVIVVHLHGLPADMDEIMSIAAERGLKVIEDAAQSHGALYRGTATGAIGDVGTFSLSISKNLPTCGEGGLLVTNSEEVALHVRALRQFGETLIHGKARRYEHNDAGWNNKLNGLQSAFINQSPFVITI